MYLLQVMSQYKLCSKNNNKYNNNKSVFSCVPYLTTWHYPHLLQHDCCWLLASCSNQSISDQYMGQMTDGWRDRRLVGWSLAPHSTQYKSFRRQSSQPITWLILTNKTVQENTDKQTQYKLEKVDNLKYSKTNLPRFSCLLQHSARKRGGLTVERPQAHTAGQRQTNTRQMRGPCYAGCDKKYCNVSGEIQGSIFNIQ